MDEKLREKIASKCHEYDEEILSALNLDDKAFFALPKWRREKYVQMTREFPDKIHALIKEEVKYET